MRYSIERKGRIYVKGYGFLTFAKKIQLKQKTQNLIREYQNKDIYLQKNDSKLLMSYN